VHDHVADVMCVELSIRTQLRHILLSTPNVGNARCWLHEALPVVWHALTRHGMVLANCILMTPCHTYIGMSLIASTRQNTPGSKIRSDHTRHGISRKSFRVKSQIADLILLRAFIMAACDTSRAFPMLHWTAAANCTLSQQDPLLTTQ